MVAGRAIGERTQVVQAQGITSEELARQLREQSDVEYAVPDGRKRISTAPNDPLYPDGVGGNGPASGQWYRVPRPAKCRVRSTSSLRGRSRRATQAWSSPSSIPARFEHPDLLEVTIGGKFLRATISSPTRRTRTMEAGGTPTPKIPAIFVRDGGERQRRVLLSMHALRRRDGPLRQ
jgi:hypothetical protein